MKHFGWLRKAAASVLALAMVAAAPAALAYSDANLEAPRAKNVVIDGDLSEWDTSRCLRIDSEKQIVDQIEHWDGEADCSMEIYAMWDEENLYIAAKVWDDTPFVYREGFPLDELDAIILFFSTNPNADPNRTAYEATDWRIVQSTDEYDFFNYIDRDMIADNLGWETQGEYGDELVFDDYEAVTVRDKEMGGYILESKIPLHNLSNDKIAPCERHHVVAGQRVQEPGDSADDSGAAVCQSDGRDAYSPRLRSDAPVALRAGAR